MLRFISLLLLSLVWSSPSPGSSGVAGKRGRPWPSEREGPNRKVGRDEAKRKFSETPLLPGPEVKGKVIGLSSNEFATFGLTDSGEIFWTRDSVRWEVIDFNEAYRGYYQPVCFVGIAAGKGSVAVVGTYEKTGAPAMFVSSRGSVWTERELTYSQGEELFELTDTPLSVRADLERDEFVITCTDGVLFFVPPCSHCNRKEYNGSD